VLQLDIDCPVDVAAGEFACVRVSNIRLDLKKIQDMIEPILRKLVNPPSNDGLYDVVVKPLVPLDEPIPGVSSITRVRVLSELIITEIAISL
jgi:hypothetical protein